MIHDYLIDETVNTLSDPKSTSEDEALQKYETVISMSFNALNMLLSYLNDQNLVDLNEKLDKLITDPKFWRFTKEKSSRVSDFFTFINL